MFVERVCGLSPLGGDEGSNRALAVEEEVHDIAAKYIYCLSDVHCTCGWGLTS